MTNRQLVLILKAMETSTMSLCHVVSISCDAKEAGPVLDEMQGLLAFYADLIAEAEQAEGEGGENA